MEEPNLLPTLQGALVGALQRIVTELRPTDGGGISGVTAVGNPAIEHILLGRSPASLGKVPYRPLFKEAQRASAREVGLHGTEDGAWFYAFPLVSGFVGGDTVAVILSTGMDRSTRPTLAIDIGTNSEVAVKSGKGLFVTSAAAGPAFEGGEVENGMVAEAGAIRSISIEGGKVHLDVIGGVAPKGICGSGLLNVVANLLHHGVIDSSGRVKGRDEIDGNLANRIREGEEGNSFILHKGVKGDISLTQGDIRAFQLAKSAIRAGITLAIERAGVEPDEIEEVYIAGAFGSNLREADLVAIGLLDERWVGRLTFLGDAALDGAKLALCSEEKREEAEEIAKRARYLSLSGSKHFQREFMKEINFVPQA
jgi:uncharacterized 2Fe-2S/4Fe-4S cluster protein (DUF4445 family)